jgi:DNA-binding NtrC family response regulator
MGEAKMSFKDQSVLIIDDGEVFREGLKAYFENKGARVYASGHLEKAVSVTEGLVSSKSPPALVVMDVRLPGCYGFTALRDINVITHGQTPIVVTSHGYNAFAVGQMRLYGAIAYVKKPVLMKTLFDFILESYEAVLKQKTHNSVLEEIKKVA